MPDGRSNVTEIHVIPETGAVCEKDAALKTIYCNNVSLVTIPRSSCPAIELLVIVKPRPLMKPLPSSL